MFGSGRAIVQEVSRQPLAWKPGFASGSVYARFVEKVEFGHVFPWVLRISLSISFHRDSPYSYIIWGMKNIPFWLQFWDMVSLHRHEHLQSLQWKQYVPPKRWHPPAGPSWSGQRDLPSDRRTDVFLLTTASKPTKSVLRTMRPEV
jgi:hypothetical protein